MRKLIQGEDPTDADLGNSPKVARSTKDSPWLRCPSCGSVWPQEREDLEDSNDLEKLCHYVSKGFG